MGALARRDAAAAGVVLGTESQKRVTQKQQNNNNENKKNRLAQNWTAVPCLAQPGGVSMHKYAPIGTAGLQMTSIGLKDPSSAQREHSHYQSKKRRQACSALHAEICAKTCASRRTNGEHRKSFKKSLLCTCAPPTSSPTCMNIPAVRAFLMLG